MPALTAFQENSYFGCDEFNDFLESTVSSVSNVKVGVIHRIDT